VPLGGFMNINCLFPFHKLIISFKNIFAFYILMIYCNRLTLNNIYRDGGEKKEQER
jgi:hypothetical protein